MCLRIECEGLLFSCDEFTADSRDGAIALLLAQPSLIKRPVLVHADRVEIGFSEAAYQALFAR